MERRERGSIGFRVDVNGTGQEGAHCNGGSFFAPVDKGWVRGSLNRDWVELCLRLVVSGRLCCEVADEGK